MDLPLILTLVAVSALAAYPMAWVQGRLGEWVAAKSPNATAAPPPSIHITARAFFIRAVMLIVMLTLFRFLLSE